MAADADAILRFRENGGGVDEKAATLDGWPVVILTTIGAKTGNIRRPGDPGDGAGAR